MKTTRRANYEESVTHDVWIDDMGVSHSDSVTEVVPHHNDIALVSLFNKPIYGEDGTQVVGYKKDIDFVSGAEAVGAVVGAIVKTVRGEMQLNRDRGIPYLGLGGVLGSKDQNTVSDWSAFTQDAISKAPGVVSIASFLYSRGKEGRKATLSYSAEIKTEYSEENVKVEGSV